MADDTTNSVQDSYEGVAELHAQKLHRGIGIVVGVDTQAFRLAVVENADMVFKNHRVSRRGTAYWRRPRRIQNSGLV